MRRQNDHCTHGPDNPAAPKSKKITRAFYDHQLPQVVFFPLRKFVLMLCKHAWKLPHFNGCQNEFSSHFSGYYCGHVKVKMAASEFRVGLTCFFHNWRFSCTGLPCSNFFFENSDNPCHKLWQNYNLRWKFFWTPLSPASMFFFSRLARKQLWNRGEGRQQILGAFFVFLPLIYGKDSETDLGLLQHPRWSSLW